jgi:glutamate formiminotransferase/glutamate formiminotransferase/formiminotetrahydrofolate cyclodeaminase
MTRRLVESVPNISEGRDQAVIDKLIASVQSVPKVALLDVHVDPDHHRSVFTIVGEPEAMGTALFGLVRNAQCYGAVDVVPWIPLQGVTMKECRDYAKALGSRVGAELGIPVFLYEQASMVDSRRKLEVIRRGGLPALQERMSHQEGWKPDYGPESLHPSCGAMVTGARFFLIAYNVVLDSRNLDLARQIGRTIRESGGGLPALKAIGVSLPSRGLVQVSMNLVDFRRTSLRAAYEAVEREAQKRGVNISLRAAYEAVEREAQKRGVNIFESELVGMLPQAAWDDHICEDLKLSHGGATQIIEISLAQQAMV